MKWLFVLLVCAVTFMNNGPVRAQTEYSAPLLGTGHYQREDAADPCTQDPNFIAGQYNSLVQIMAGGNNAGCDSEWGFCAEFDFSASEEGNEVLSAVLSLRYTGYGDDSGGLPYLGLFDYEYSGAPVLLPRAEFNDQTALAVFQPTGSTGVDFDFDVTDLVTGLLEEGKGQVGFFVCGVFSEVGYDSLVYFGASDGQYPPRLMISTAQVVQARPTSWGMVKTCFR